VGLIFRSALLEELERENRAEDVALSLDAINRCLLNMLTALDRDPADKEWSCTPQPRNTGVYYYPGITMALVHAPGVRIPLTLRRIPQTNTPGNRGINAEVYFKRPRLGTSR